MKFLLTSCAGCFIILLLAHPDTYAQKENELYSASYYRYWYDLFNDTIVPDSFHFSVKNESDRFLDVDKILKPKSGKLRRRDFGGYAFNVEGKFFARHMFYTGYINDQRLLVRYHVLGLYGAIFVDTNDPIIHLEKHSFTGFGLIGDAISDAVKSKNDGSNRVWQSKEGKAYSIIFYRTRLNEDGTLKELNPDAFLLSEKRLNNLAIMYNMDEEFVNKTDWTAEEIGVFLTKINERAGRSIVGFEGLNFSSEIE